MFSLKQLAIESNEAFHSDAPLRWMPMNCGAEWPLGSDNGLSGFENVWHCLSGRMPKHPLKR